MLILSPAEDLCAFQKAASPAGIGSGFHHSTDGSLKYAEPSSLTQIVGSQEGRAVLTPSSSFVNQQHNSLKGFRFCSSFLSLFLGFKLELVSYMETLFS